MATRSTQPFTLGHLMIVVAALAFGLALDRWIWSRPLSYPMGTSPQAWGVGNWLAAAWLKAPGSMAAALTVALIGLRWLGPRPTVSQVIRQPGAVACLAMVGAVLASVAIELVQEWLKRIDPSNRYPIVVFEHSYYWGTALRMVSPVVFGAWSALFLSGGWSAERSWVDRLGLALGWFWLAYYPIDRSVTVLNVLIPCFLWNSS